MALWMENWREEEKTESSFLTNYLEIQWISAETMPMYSVLHFYWSCFRDGEKEQGISNDLSEMQSAFRKY